LDLGEARTAYFTLLWSVERVAAGRLTIDQGWFRRRRPRFLDQLVSWQVAYWADHRQQVKEALEAGLAAEIGAAGGIRQLVTAGFFGPVKPQLLTRNDNEPDQGP
jgi:hypothetical protein